MKKIRNVHLRHTRRNLIHRVDPAFEGNRDAFKSPTESDFLGSSRRDTCRDFVQDLLGEIFNIACRDGRGGWTLAEEDGRGESERPETTVEGSLGEFGAFLMNGEGRGCVVMELSPWREVIV